jgi:signal transduction histidine kinase
MQPDARVLASVRGEVRRLTRLADDLQKVSRAEERQLDLHLARVVPQELVETARAAAAPGYADKGVQLATAADNTELRVQVDPDRLGEVLANLLENALRHTPAGGTVTLEAHANGNGTVELSVSDSGDGIAAEHLPRVFERFYRADRARDRAGGGSGIGLAIAKAIVEAHGGRINAESEGPGRGATFRVALPARSS